MKWMEQLGHSQRLVLTNSHENGTRFLETLVKEI